MSSDKSNPYNSLLGRFNVSQMSHGQFCKKKKIILTYRAKKLILNTFSLLKLSIVFRPLVTPPPLSSTPYAYYGFLRWQALEGKPKKMQKKVGNFTSYGP